MYKRVFYGFIFIISNNNRVILVVIVEICILLLFLYRLLPLLCTCLLLQQNISKTKGLLVVVFSLLQLSRISVRLVTAVGSLEDVLLNDLQTYPTLSFKQSPASGLQEREIKELWAEWPNGCSNKLHSFVFLFKFKLSLNLFMCYCYIPHYCSSAFEWWSELVKGGLQNVEKFILFRVNRQSRLYFNEFESKWNLRSSCFHSVKYVASFCVLCGNLKVKFMVDILTWVYNLVFQPNKRMGSTFSGPCIVIYSYDKSQWDALFLKFILTKSSTCFRQLYCPSSGFSTLYMQQYVFVMLDTLTVY